MPRPKNYAFEKAQRERARLARKAARKEARKDSPDDVENPEADDAAAVEEEPTDKGE